MGKQIIINEEQLNELVKSLSEKEIEEGILDPLKNRYQGLKGVFRGYGYDYFKMGSELRNIARQLRKLDQPNEKLMVKLRAMMIKAQASNMRPELKKNLVDAIQGAVTNFEDYKDYLNKLDVAISARLR